MNYSQQKLIAIVVVSSVALVSCKLPSAPTSSIHSSNESASGGLVNLDAMMRIAAEEFRTGKFAPPEYHPEIKLENLSVLMEGMPILAGESNIDVSGMALDGLNNVEPTQEIVSLASYTSPIKNQGQEGACSAFATLAAMETKFASQGNPISNFSTAHLWSLYKYPQIMKAVEAAQKNLIMPDEYWPWGGTRSGVPPNTYGIKLDKVEFVRPDQIHGLIGQQIPVVMGISTNQAIQNVGKDGIVVIKDKSEDYLKFGESGHAIMIVASQKFSVPVNGITGFWAFKNSWGTGWGAEGVGFLPYEYCKLKADACRPLKIASVSSKMFSKSSGLDSLQNSARYLLGMDMVAGDKSLPGNPPPFFCRGLRIVAMQPQGLAAKSGFKVNDCILFVGDNTIKSLEDYDNVLANLKDQNADRAEFHVYRGPNVGGTSVLVTYPKQ